MSVRCILIKIRFCLQIKVYLVKNKSKEEGKYQESSTHLTRDTIWESDKNTRKITHKRAKRSALSHKVIIRLREPDSILKINAKHK